MGAIKRILVVTPYRKDSNSWWRCLGPLTYLAKHSSDEISITLGQEEDLSWPEVMAHDVVFLHRPCRQDDLTVVKIAKNCGVPIWVDYDDWLYDVPAWNVPGSFYHQNDVQHLMAHITACADIVSVTTSALYNKIFAVNPNVILIPNAYRSDLFPYRADHPPERDHIAVWRGTATHDADLLSVAGGFKGLNAKVHFLGSPYWCVLSSLPKDSYRVTSAQDVMMYFKYVYTLRPKVLVFPLVNCFFNHCKSNIAYIEALHAGALCVAPDFPEWKKPGILNYEPHNENSFRDTVNHVLTMDKDTHREKVKDAFQKMKEYYDISVVNEFRKAVVETITSPGFKLNTKDPWDQLTGLYALSKLKEIQMVVEKKHA